MLLPADVGSSSARDVVYKRRTNSPARRGDRGLLARLTCFSAAVLLLSSPSKAAEEPVKTALIEAGEMSVIFRDNSGSPRILSGIDSLRNVAHAADYDAFDPTGLNFEHVISGHPSPFNRFAPRQGRFDLYALPDQRSVKLVRHAQDSPWKVASSLSLTVKEPDSIDFEFQCIPQDASLFGERGWAIFFFANYMNDVEDVALHFRGLMEPGGEEAWISAEAPPGPVDWRGGGNYRSLDAPALRLDDDVEFRLNTWSYEWPRVTRPFFYGRASHGMTLILMFDRMYSEQDEIRFSLYKFKLPRYPRPAWDFQYVIHQVRSGQKYGFRGRLVFKKFVSPEDCLREYEEWDAGSD